MSILSPSIHGMKKKLYHYTNLSPTYKEVIDLLEDCWCPRPKEPKASSTHLHDVTFGHVSSTLDTAHPMSIKLVSLINLLSYSIYLTLTTRPQFEDEKLNKNLEMFTCLVLWSVLSLFGFWLMFSVGNEVHLVSTRSFYEMHILLYNIISTRFMEAFQFGMLCDERLFRDDIFYVWLKVWNVELSTYLLLQHCVIVCSFQMFGLSMILVVCVVGLGWNQW